MPDSQVFSPSLFLALKYVSVQSSDVSCFEQKSLKVSEQFEFMSVEVHPIKVVNYRSL